LLALPLVLTPYTHDLVVKIMVLSVFALSLELLVGMTGLVSLGHAAFLGMGAYVAVLLSPEADPGNLLAAGRGGGRGRGYALFVGALSLRTKGVYFIMVTLAFAQMAYFVFHDTKLGGGTDGIYLNVRPVLGPLDAATSCTCTTCVLGALALTYGCWRCCGARASAMRWRASASTSSACAPPASPPTATSWRPSCCPVPWPGWRASCWR
jgi:branched-chain amino acid transport system permease protein